MKISPLPYVPRDFVKAINCQPWEQIWCRNHLGWVAWARGDLAAAEEHYRRGLARARDAEIDGGVAWCTSGLGLVALSRGDLAAAEECFTRALALVRTGVIPFDVSYMLNCLARVALERGDHMGARALFCEAITTVHTIPGRWNIALALEGLAGVALAERRLPRAARLLGGAAELRAVMGAAHWPPFVAGHEQLLTTLRSELGAETFAVAWEAGRTLNLSELLAEAQDASGAGVAPRPR